jgi:hypothetical protein
MRAGIDIGCGGKICSRTYLDGVEKIRLTSFLHDFETTAAKSSECRERDELVAR